MCTGLDTQQATACCQCCGGSPHAHLSCRKETSWEWLLLHKCSMLLGASAQQATCMLHVCKVKKTVRRWCSCKTGLDLILQMLLSIDYVVVSYLLLLKWVLAFIKRSKRCIYNLSGFWENSWQYEFWELCQSWREVTWSCPLRWRAEGRLSYPHGWSWQLCPLLTFRVFGDAGGAVTYALGWQSKCNMLVGGKSSTDSSIYGGIHICLILSCILLGEVAQNLWRFRFTFQQAHWEECLLEGEGARRVLVISTAPSSSQDLTCQILSVIQRWRKL